MSDKVSIDLQDNSKYRVALDLAKLIAYDEKTPKTREYWLQLYGQCRSVVHNGSLVEDALKR
jgi:hypothetical protein